MSCCLERLQLETSLSRQVADLLPTKLASMPCLACHSLLVLTASTKGSHLVDAVLLSHTCAAITYMWRFESARWHDLLDNMHCMLCKFDILHAVQSMTCCDTLQAVQVMTKICAESERSLDYYGLFKQIMKRAPVPMSPLESLASSAVRTAHKVSPPCPAHSATPVPCTYSHLICPP